MAEARVKRRYKFPLPTVWAALVDLESWVKWAPPDATNRLIKHKIIERVSDTVIICHEIEHSKFGASEHLDRYILTPMTHIREEVLPGGDFTGFFEMDIKGNAIETAIEVYCHFEVPKDKPLARGVDAIFGDDTMKEFWKDLLGYLADYLKRQAKQ